MAVTIRAARQQVVWTSGTNIVLGLWLIVAPFLLGYSGLTAALWNDILFGVVIAVMATLRARQPMEHEGYSWTNAVIGVWLVLAPFVLGYGNADIEPALARTAQYNDIIVGLAVLVLGSWSGYASKAGKSGGGEQRP